MFVTKTNRNENNDRFWISNLFFGVSMRYIFSISQLENLIPKPDSVMKSWPRIVARIVTHKQVISFICLQFPYFLVDVIVQPLHWSFYKLL